MPALQDNSQSQSSTVKTVVHGSEERNPCSWSDAKLCELSERLSLTVRTGRWDVGRKASGQASDTRTGMDISRRAP
ncbi:hypothetical protein E4U21_006739 [Claviceps maximensis]|nr:hypothetical protein E4U21_006739 [Claviceps maximensis]